MSWLSIPPPTAATTRSRGTETGTPHYCSLGPTADEADSDDPRRDPKASPRAYARRCHPDGWRNPVKLRAVAPLSQPDLKPVTI